MALRDFWISVRRGSGLITPEWIADCPRFDAPFLERTLQGSTLWRTPHTVDGFDPMDLSFLPVDELRRLTDLVDGFLEVACQWDPKLPAPAQTVAKALPLFRDIVELLGFDRYGDPEAFRLGKRIEQELKSDWPEELAEIRFQTGLDHSGDAGLWIWAFVKDDAAQSDEQFLASAETLGAVVEPAARKVVPDRWPYLSFRSLGEQSELVGQA